MYKLFILLFIYSSSVLIFGNSYDIATFEPGTLEEIVLPSDKLFNKAHVDYFIPILTLEKQVSNDKILKLNLTRQNFYSNYETITSVVESFPADMEISNIRILSQQYSDSEYYVSYILTENGEKNLYFIKIQFDGTENIEVSDKIKLNNMSVESHISYITDVGFHEILRFYWTEGNQIIFSDFNLNTQEISTPEIAFTTESSNSEILKIEDIYGDRIFFSINKTYYVTNNDLITQLFNSTPDSKLTHSENNFHSDPTTRIYLNSSEGKNLKVYDISFPQNKKKDTITLTFILETNLTENQYLVGYGLKFFPNESYLTRDKIVFFENNSGAKTLKSKTINDDGALTNDELYYNSSNELNLFASTKNFSAIEQEGSFYAWCEKSENQETLKLFVDLTTIGSIEEDNTQRSAVLINNYPNPFNPSTNIEFILNKSSQVKLEIFNIKGEIIKQVMESKLDKGKYNFDFNGQNLNSGSYLFRVTTEEGQYSRKLLLLK